VTRVLLLLAAVGVPMARVLHARRAALAGLAHVHPLTQGTRQNPGLPHSLPSTARPPQLRTFRLAWTQPTAPLIMQGLRAQTRAAPPCSPCLAAYVALLLLRAKVGGMAEFDTVL